MLPESFGGRIIYLLQQYGPSGWYRADDPGGQK